MALKTDYKNFVLDTSQNPKPRYRMIDNGDGTVSFEEVSVYAQEGDPFSAADINSTNKAVGGYVDKDTEFLPDGSIKENNPDGSYKLTTFNPDGSITETEYNAEGEAGISKTTSFNADGSISERVS